MSRSLGSELPAALVDRLRGGNLEAVAADAVPICTVDRRGWPHPALLSYFEVIAVDARRIRLATYSDSTTTANMRANGRLTLMLVVDGTLYYIKGQVRELSASMKTVEWNTASECVVEDVLADEVDQEHEPGACVSSGVKYHSPRRSSDLARARAVLLELLELG